VLLAGQNYILRSQAKRGAMYLVPHKYKETYYNYNKSKEELVELNVDLSGLDCSICLLGFGVLDGEIGEGKDSALFVDNYEMSIMVTPCKHVFHTECLQSWAVIKLECPVCKQQLPYID
jgi:hypothetical protein